MCEKRELASVHVQLVSWVKAREQDRCIYKRCEISHLFQLWKKAHLYKMPRVSFSYF